MKRSVLVIGVLLGLLCSISGLAGAAAGGAIEPNAIMVSLGTEPSGQVDLGYGAGYKGVARR